MYIYSVYDPEFKSYGKVLEGYDTAELVKAMNDIPMPEAGVSYEPAIASLEECSILSQLENRAYGGMPIQIGYCNGRNTTYNGFEYHKGSEINIAVTDFMLVLGHTWLIKDNTYRVEDAQVFFVEKGTAIEMYQTTLHLSPCRTCDEGFKDIVVLPKGTNTPWPHGEDLPEDEAKLLLQRNKWVIAHPEREPLIRQGAFPGLLGENKALNY